MNFDFNPVTTLVPANALMYQTPLLVCITSLVFVVICGLATTISLGVNDRPVGAFIAFFLFAGLIAVDIWGINTNLNTINTAQGNQRYVTETHDKIKATYGLSLSGDQLDDLLTTGSNEPLKGSVDTYLVGTTAYVKDGQRTELALYWRGRTATLVNQDKFLADGLSGSELPHVGAAVTAG